MKILIVEPQATGHHMALYTRLIVEAARRRGWILHLLTTKSAIEHPSYKLVEAAADGEITVHFIQEVECPHRTDSLSLLFTQFVQFRAIKKGFRQLLSHLHPDYIYLVNLDHCDKIISLLGSPFRDFPFSGMMMSLKYHRCNMGIGPAGRSDRLYELLFRRLLKIPTLQKVSVIDEAFVEYAQQSSCTEYSKLQFIPDPGELIGEETKEHARSKLGISNSGFVILIYGRLTLRKGIRELLNALVINNVPEVSVLLAGMPDKEVNKLLCEPEIQSLFDNERLFLQLEFHDSINEYRVFRAVDAVWVGYVDSFFGSSGVFYQAGSLKLPVFASSSGLLGWLVERHHNGLCVVPDHTKSVVDAIKSLHEDVQFRDQLGENGFRLSLSHTGRLFGDSICKII